MIVLQCKIGMHYRNALEEFAERNWHWRSALLAFGIARESLSIQRYKGLGEMNPDQLWETTLNPAQRNMRRVCIGEATEANKTIETLMGNSAEALRVFIERRAAQLRPSPIDI